MNPDDFDFVVTELLIEPGVSPRAETLYPVLDIKAQNNDSTKCIVKVWDKCKEAVVGQHGVANTDKPGWCNDNIASWVQKQPASDELRYAAWYDDILIGFVNLLREFPSEVVPGDKVMYVKYVMTAPWQLKTVLWPRSIHGIGRALLAFSVLQSASNGMGGRIGLHARDSEVEGWYDHMNSQYGNQLFALKKVGVGGPKRGNGDIPDMEKQYYEADSTGAIKLLEEYRRA